MRPVELSDVAARARGIARHLLGAETLRQLARSSGPGVLTGALQRFGYWTQASSGGSSLVAGQVIDAAIEGEIARRFDVLARWLGDRIRYFAGVFGDEERRAIRIRLRTLAAGVSKSAPAEGVAAGGPWRGAWGSSRRARDRIAQASDVPGLVNALVHAGHPYAQALATARREAGADVLALERALDRAHAARAHAAARAIGGPLLAWVEEGIDLENAWDALAGGGGGAFLEGGVRLSRDHHLEIAATPETAARRTRMAERFAGGPLGAVFRDVRAPLESLEARAQAVRADVMHARSRIDPIGAAPILELTMRLRIERSNLRCISWGVAQGQGYDAIVAAIEVAS